MLVYAQLEGGHPGRIPQYLRVHRNQTGEVEFTHAVTSRCYPVLDVSFVLCHFHRLVRGNKPEG